MKNQASQYMWLKRSKRFLLLPSPCLLLLLPTIPQRTESDHGGNVSHEFCCENSNFWTTNLTNYVKSKSLTLRIKMERRKGKKSLMEDLCLHEEASWWRPTTYSKWNNLQSVCCSLGKFVMLDMANTLWKTNKRKH